jgi:hypothetical protein
MMAREKAECGIEGVEIMMWGLLRKVLFQHSPWPILPLSWKSGIM